MLSTHQITNKFFVLIVNPTLQFLVSQLTFFILPYLQSLRRHDVSLSCFGSRIVYHCHFALKLNESSDDSCNWFFQFFIIANPVLNWPYFLFVFVAIFDKLLD